MARTKNRGETHTIALPYNVLAWTIGKYIRLSKEDLNRGKDDSNSVDSYKNPDSISSILVPITNVMNDQYCYQTSKKIRQVFDYKRRNGEYIGSFAPYGYLKDPEDRHALVVDEEAAEMVRQIFSMFLGGMAKNAISRYFNDHGIICPSQHKRNLGQKYVSPRGSDNPLWAACTIDSILKNQMYCGDMVQGRYRVKSYKVHTLDKVPENEWYIVENTHEPIIDRETFEKAQQLLKRDTRVPPKKKELYLFSGFLRCADCGKSVARNRDSYRCSTYEQQAARLQMVLDNLFIEQSELEHGIDTENPFLTAFREHENIDKLTRDILIELIDHIKIYEGGNISVKFKFSDELRRIAEYVDINTKSAAV